jgi:serine/threonine protein kinase
MIDAIASSLNQPFAVGQGFTQPEVPLQPGCQLAWFCLGQLLVHDHCGQLWNANDLVAEHGVTIRVLPHSLARSSEDARRVKEYYRATHSLHHPSIAPVHCLGLDATAGYFLVMGQFAGAILPEYCRSHADKNRRMALRDAIKLLAPVARALDYAHEHGVVHGDLRPQNVLIDDKGNVQVSAFGLSQLAETANIESADVLRARNTQPYRAPELSRGERASPKSDQYTLAVMSYELLIGELPTNDGCTLFAMVKPEHLPEHVAAAFTRALSSDRAERFESSTAFVQALIGEDIPSRKAMGTLGANYLSELAAKAKETTVRQQVSAQRPNAAEQDSQEPESDRESETASAPRKARLAAAKFEPIRKMEAHRNGVTTVAFSKDGRLVLSGGKDKDVRVRDAKNARELRSLKGHSDRVNAVAFCTDGRRAVSCSDDATIRVWETDTGRQVRCLAAHRGAVKSIALAPRGDFILSGGEDATLRLWNLEMGEELQQFGGLFSRHQGAIHGLAYAHNSALAVSGSLDGTVRLWNLENGRQMTRLLKQKEGVNCVCFSADDRFVVAGTQNGKIHVWEVESGEQVFRLDGHQKPVWSVACSPLGGRVLSAGWDGAICMWDLDSGSQLNRFTGHTSGVNSIAFSPDGHTAISGGFDGNLQFWSL